MALTQDPNPDNPLIGDLDLQNGQIHFWDKTAARRQKVRAICLFFKGEWFLNPDEGMPYFQSVIGNRRQTVILDVLRKAFHAGLPDLAKILHLSMTFEASTRTAVVDFALLFDDGFVLNSADFGPVEIK